MNLESKSGRRVRRVCALLGIAALAVLASCGGGTLENAFSPQRIVSFGDETSILTPAGTKYSVNYLDTTVNADNCALYPVWTQYLAGNFNLPFPGCVASGATAPSVMNAVVGATVTGTAATTGVSGLVEQIDAQAAAGFTNRDLVTIMVGAHDIVEQYALYVSGAQDLATAQSVLTQRAIAVSAQVTRLIGLGSKVLISTVPNQGLTPFGLADAQRSADLTTLSSTFNNALRTALINDSGRDVGLILADEIVRLDSVYPDSYNIANVNTAVCANTALTQTGLLSCNSSTLVSSVDPYTWLWAGNAQIGPLAQSQIGAQAVSRATNNPF